MADFVLIEPSAMLPSRGIAGAPRALSSLLLAAALGSCASSAAQRRATAIADADLDARRAVAAESRLDPGKIPARAFAVTPFTVAARDTLLTPLGFGLADLLATDLARSPELQMVERMHVEAIFRELSLVEEGVTDPRTAPRIGRLIGARRLLIGSVSRLPSDDVLLQARVVDVIAGTVQDVVSARAPLDRIIDAEKELAILLLQRLGITLTPAQRQRVELRQTTQVAALAAYGRGVEAESHGDAAGAMEAFEEASRLDAAFAAARTAVTAAPTASSRGASVQRVLDLSTQAINQPIASRLPEAVDAPLSASQIITILISVHIF